MKIVLAQINPIVGAFDYNCKKIIFSIENAKKQGGELILFPELALVGYPPEDLLFLPQFVEQAAKTLEHILPYTQNITAIVGTIRKNLFEEEKGLFNSAAVIENGKLLGFYDKILLPDYDVFSERRYFEPGGKAKIWNLRGKKFAITICEDIWHYGGFIVDSKYRRDPIKELSVYNPDIALNLSASPYSMGRLELRLQVCTQVASFLNCPLFLCNQVGGNDSLIFDGSSLCVSNKGKMIKVARSFEEDLILLDSDQVYQSIHYSDQKEDLLRALILGVRDYFHKMGFQKACFGLSGGIDSAVVAFIAKAALGEENLLALSLPSRYSSLEGIEDSKILAKQLQIPLHEIPIEEIFESFLSTLEPFFKNCPTDVTEENIQARIRGTLLMSFANKFNYILLNTSNKSEMALGYSTIYGDMCGGLAVLSDVTKEQVYLLAKLINHDQEIIPLSIIDRAPSAELRKNQKDSDSLPNYPIIDRLLEDYVEEGLSIEEIVQKDKFPFRLVKDLVRKIHLSEYKRRQAPLGLRVTKKSFGVGRRFPIVQHWNI